jgi:hypothetical protein
MRAPLPTRGSQESDLSQKAHTVTTLDTTRVVSIRGTVVMLGLVGIDLNGANAVAEATNHSPGVNATADRSELALAHGPPPPVLS